MRDVLLTLHILGAMGFIGGGVYSAVIFNRDVAELGLKRVLARTEPTDNRFFGVAVGVLLLSGIALVIESDVYGWGEPFVLIGIGTIIVTGILEGGIFGPALKRLARMRDDLGAPGRRILRWSAVVHIVVLVFAVWAMVTKLGA